MAAPMPMPPTASDAPTIDLIGTPAFQPGRQCSQVTVFDIDTGERQVLLTSPDHLEAPNWTPDGRWLVLNGGGALYRLPADGGGALERLDIPPALDLNNDHVLAPDGRTLYLSANDGHLYAVPWPGGPATRLTRHGPEHGGPHHYLHGISPDGRTLAWVGLWPEGTPQRWALGTVPAEGGDDTLLQRGELPVDGPEYTPDGQWLLFNGEPAGAAPGHAQLHRMRPDGGGTEQLTHDDRVNWFPHPSPDGRWLLWLSYPPGTLGHPANRIVRLRLQPADGGPARDLAELLGGQGTLNVNSWAPDSRRFAYLAYPALAAPR